MKINQILNEGIIHIEDLPVEKFIRTIRNINKHSFTEKIDGFNMRFGIDENGFYSKTKSGDAKRDASDYGNEFRYTGFKAAHNALVSILPNLLKENLISIGDEIEVEVLFGQLPNTVPYNNEKNRIIFLKVKKGTADILRIKEALQDVETNVEIESPVTRDGKTIESENRSFNWVFTSVPRKKRISVQNVSKLRKLNKKLQSLESYLEKKSSVANFRNVEILALPLNRKPKDLQGKNWKEIKELIRSERDHIRKEVMNFKLDIKEDLLNELVRNTSSEFGPEIENGGWIEGIVLSNTENSELIKLVDKDIFTALNEFNWHVRNKISANAKGTKKVDTLIGKIKVSLAKSIGHSELGTQQKNRYIEKNNISVEDISKDINFDKTKKKFEVILDKGENLLNKYFDLYEKYKDSMSKELDFGEFKREFKIDDSLNEKNLEAFAELYELIRHMKYRVKNSSNSSDLVRILIGN